MSGLHRGGGLPVAGHRQAAGASRGHSPSADEMAEEEPKASKEGGAAGNNSSARALARSGRSSRGAAADAARGYAQAGTKGAPLSGDSRK